VAGGTVSDMGYLDAYVPSGENTSRSARTAWSGLNRKQPQDAGVLSDAFNVSVRDLPYLRTAPLSETLRQLDGLIHGIYDVGDGAYVVVTQTWVESFSYLWLWYFKGDIAASCAFSMDTGTIPTSVVPFNVYTDKDGNSVSSTFERKILVFPQCVSFTPPTASGSFTVASFNTKENPVPTLSFAAVHLGRLWGVKDGKFFASGWNDYADWALPTPEDLDGDVSAFPWVSATQSDVNADGNFTAIAVYDNHVIGFKKNYMHMIYNNKNPFRIVDVARVGALSQKAVCECNQILFFVGEDGVYAFTGGYPERISDALELSSYEGAVLGADEVTLYCSIPGDGVYTFDTVNRAWGRYTGNTGYEMPAQCATVRGECLYAAPADNAIKRFGGEDYNINFSFDTDATYGGQLVEKRLKRIRLQAVHGHHAEGDFLTVSVLSSPKGKPVMCKTLTPTGDGTFVLSSLLRMACDFGHVVRVEGKGDFEIRYLQMDYTAGGERYV
jgi:hypothetical protein